ncbi:MFS transporter [Pseudokineococcus basanitobsidens]|uniref:MFS transporter n=1 Tax=Pseudokineococcus basanitobsidens TaxID=1926649 RepID=A0ABU8RGK4_9ACTN
MTSPSTARVAGGPARDRLPVGTLLLLAAVVFAAVTTEVLPVGLLPQIAADLGVGEARVGWWVSAYAVVVALGALPVTALVARWPQRRVLLVLALVYAASNVLLVAGGSFWVGLAARVLAGLAHAAVFSVVVALAVGLSPPRRRGRAVALVSSGVGVALALGVPLGTAVGTAWGWRWGFVLTAVVLVVLAAATAVLLPRDAAPATADGGRSSVLGELRRPSLLVVAVVAVVLITGHQTVYTYVSPLLRDAGVGPADVALVLLGYGGASLLGLAVAGAVVDRAPLLALRTTVAALAVVLVLLAVATGSAPVTVVLVVAWGGVFGALPVLLQDAALDATDVPPAAPAVVNASFNVGITVGALAGGSLLAAGPPVLSVVGGGLVVAALALTTLVRRR